MPIDLLAEEPLALCEATRLLPFRPSRTTLNDWRVKGRRSAEGKLVFLETLLVGGRRYTTREAVQRFIDELNGEPAV